MKKQGETSPIFMKHKRWQVRPKVLISLSTNISVRDCLISQGDVFVATSISSCKKASVYVKQMYRKVISFRQIYINIAFSFQQTPNFAYNWVPPFERLLLSYLLYLCRTLYGHRLEKTCLRGFANNTGADQPAHPHSLISAFVIRVLLSTISKLATNEISFF